MLGDQVGKLLSSFVRSGAANMAAPIRHGAIKAAAAIFAGFLALAAMCTVAFAIWVYAIPYTGAAGAALIAAAYLLFAGLVVIGIAAWAVGNEVKPVTANSTQQIPLIMNQLIKEQKGTLLLAALVAGMMAAENQRKR